MREKIYLGDSVYAEYTDGPAIILTTENGFGPTNTIVIEPDVYRALVEFAMGVCRYKPPTTEPPETTGETSP